MFSTNKTFVSTKTISNFNNNNNNITNLFLCGDVMLGRGIDQILKYPSPPRIYETYVKDARTYVQIAEKVNGNFFFGVHLKEQEKIQNQENYVWGDCLNEMKLFEQRMFNKYNIKNKDNTVKDTDNQLEQQQQEFQGMINSQLDFKIINLETSITKNEKYWPHKGIQYRMNPENIYVLKQFPIDCCSLANNHVLDWHYQGLTETLNTLQNNQLNYTGAGINKKEAMKPVICRNVNNNDKILVVFGACSTSSGVPQEWKADDKTPGVNLIDINNRNDREELVQYINTTVSALKKENSNNNTTITPVISVLSIHWGSNWGFQVPKEHREFAHYLMDACQENLDIIHGHSSHHFLGLEVYKNKLIMYGCGDFLNDYEGITSHEEYRGDLSLMYFVSLNTTTTTNTLDTDTTKSGLINDNKLFKVELIPTTMNKFRTMRVNDWDDLLWIENTLSRECEMLGTRVIFDEEQKLFNLQW
ncbi:hypothetical protein ABK040_009924 [Willaertia magna]